MLHAGAVADGGLYQKEARWNDGRVTNKLVVSWNAPEQTRYETRRDVTKTDEPQCILIIVGPKKQNQILKVWELGDIKTLEKQTLLTKFFCSANYHK